MADKKVQEELPPSNLPVPNNKPDPTLIKFVQKLFEQENQIIRLWKEGLPPKFIQMQYPSYSEDDIINICQARYDISKFDFKVLDGALFMGYMEDMGTLEKLYSNTNILGEKLSIMNLKLSARDRAVRLRQLIESIYGTPRHSNDDENEEDTITGSLEIKLKRRLSQAKTPEEKQKLFEDLERLQEEFLEGELIRDENGS